MKPTATAAKVAALSAVRKILACDHADAEKCPKLRSPSCQHALAYFESIEPGFVAAWRDPPKHPIERAIGSATPKEVLEDLAKIRGRLPLGETKREEPTK